MCGEKDNKKENKKRNNWMNWERKERKLKKTKKCNLIQWKNKKKRGQSTFLTTMWIFRTLNFEKNVYQIT